MTKYEATPPQADELEGMAGDIVYEFVMLQNTTSWCIEARLRRDRSSGVRKAEPSMRADAYLESALTHARNLAHFFSCNLGFDEDGNRDGDDVFAVDYLPDWKPKGRDLEVLRSTVRAVNKRVHHITAFRQRVPKADDAGDMITIVDAAKFVWARFTKALPPDHQVWFRVPVGPKQ
jgi:hypothetical protein